MNDTERRAGIFSSTLFLVACSPTNAVSEGPGTATDPPSADLGDTYPPTLEATEGCGLDGPLCIDLLTAGMDAYLDQKGNTWGEAFVFSGTILVTQRGEVIYSRSGGEADHGTHAENDADTNFRIGSVTKQFTATAILRLQEEGRLSVEDPITKHLPDYPGETGDTITIHQLLTHTSGIPNYTNDPTMMDWAHEEHSTAEMLELFWELPLDFPPGERFSYSNSGYSVLGAIIEAVTGTSYGEYVQTELFERAGLTRTVYGDAEGMPNRALGYSVDGEEMLVDADRIHMSVPHAAGGVRSTAHDLALWDEALRGSTLLSDASMSALYTPEQAGYAYGWMIGELDGHRVIQHGGGIPGFGTDFLRVPDRELVIVVWSNVMGGAPGVTAHTALDLLAGKTGLPEADPRPQPLGEDAAERYAGHFALTKSSIEQLGGMGMPVELLESIATIDIEVHESQILVVPVAQEVERFFYTGEAHRFFAKDAEGTTMRFHPGETTIRLESLVFRQGGLTFEYLRSESEGG